jgi:ATP-dependent exoDNAse (exonuclease V) beta subunit
MTDEQNLLRPDKIFELEEVVVIIDFKTGELKEQDHQQLKRYVELLKAIYGASRSIESYLYYTYNSSFIRCD